MPTNVLLAKKRVMSSFKKILIVVDLSTHSLNAVRYVALNSSSTDLRVNLLYVMPTAPEIFWDLERDAFFKETMKTKYAQWKRKGTTARSLWDGEACPRYTSSFWVE